MGISSSHDDKRGKVVAMITAAAAGTDLVTLYFRYCSITFKFLTEPNNFSVNLKSIYKYRFNLRQISYFL